MPDFSKMCKDFALHYTDECIFMLDEKGTILHTTSDVKRICDLNKKDILQKKIFTIVRKEDKKHIKNFLAQLSKKPKAKNTITFQIPTKKEATQYYQIRAINLLSEPGINLIIAYIRNITTQKQTEEDLHKKNNEYKELLEFHHIITDNTLDVIFQVTLSGTYTFMNKASKRIAGYDPEEMIGKKWMTFVPKKELPKYFSKVTELLKGKKIDDFQTFVIHKKGHLVPVEFSGSIIKKNNQTYITGVMRDLSKRLDSKRVLEDLAKALEKQAKARTKELLESETKYRRLIENANEAILVAQNEIIQYANPKAIDLFGYPKKELYVKPFIEFIHPEDKDLVLQRYKQRIKGGFPPSRYEFRVLDRHHRVHWVEISAVQFEWNNKPATLNFLIDVTKRKTLEDKYQRLFDNSPEFLAEVDGETEEILAVNQKMVESFEVSKDELVGKKWSELLPPKVYQHRYQIGKKALTQNTTEIFVDKRGKRYFRNIFAPIEYANGKRNLQILSQDITEIEKAKQSLIEQEEQLRAITTSAKDAIILMDEKDRVQFWNPAAEAIFGYSEEEIMGKKIHRLIAKDSMDDRFKMGFQQFKKTGTGPVIGKNLELTATTKQGNDIVIELSVSAIKLRNRWHAIGIARDITERKHMRDALRKSRDRLEETVQKRTAELQESEKKYRQLFESAPVGIAIADLQGHVFDMNSTMKKISGFTTGKNNTFDFDNHYVSPDDRKHIRKKLVKQKSLHNVELALKRKNGERYTALLDVKKTKISGEERFLVIQRDISTIKEIQQEITKTKNYLQNILNSAKECVIAIDTFQHITLWNTTAEQFTGLSAEKVVGKSIHSLSVFESTQPFSDALKNLSKGYGYSPEEIIITSPTKTVSIVLFSASPIIQGDDDSQKIQGIVFVGADVSKDSQRRGKLLDKTSYLLLHSTSKQAVDKFVSLQISGYHGACFTRRSKVLLKKDFSPISPEIYVYTDLLSDVDSSDQVLPRIKKIFEQIITSHKKTVFLFDRLDYLFTRFSFQDVLRLIYDITPLISAHQAILLIRINPKILDEQQIQFLQEELFVLPTEKVEPIELDEHLYEMIRFIQHLNHKNIVVSFQKVGKRFSISKVTTKKRLDELEKQGLITINIKGRMKSVHLTKKARLLLEQSNLSE